MESIPISKLKAFCLSILPRVSKTSVPVMITKNGEPLVVIYPASKIEGRKKAGFMKGTAEITGDIINFDSSSEWEVLK